MLAAFPTFGASRTAVERALAEAMAGRFGYWDALLLAAAHEAGCSLCFSEDMAPFAQNGLSDRARAVLQAFR